MSRRKFPSSSLLCWRFLLPVSDGALGGVIGKKNPKFHQRRHHEKDERQEKTMAEENRQDDVVPACHCRGGAVGNREENCCWPNGEGPA